MPRYLVEGKSVDRETYLKHVEAETKKRETAKVSDTKSVAKESK